MPRKKGDYNHDQDYINAVAVLYGRWIDAFDIENELYYKSPDPEKMVIKQDQWNNLSQEAREIIQAILYSPSEILDHFKTPMRKRWSKKRIKKYFSYYWHSEFITELTIEEIENWVKQL